VFCPKPDDKCGVISLIMIVLLVDGSKDAYLIKLRLHVVVAL